MAKNSSPNHTSHGGAALLERTSSERPSRTPAMPSFKPGPGTKNNGTSSATRPKTLSHEERMITETESIGGAMPTLMPPQSVSVSKSATAWASDARVNALWSINENRNAWIGVADVGWRKLANNSDTAVVALTMLAAHARETQSSYSYREEADGMIHECYIW
jgi:hypothetical protein